MLLYLSLFGEEERNGVVQNERGRLAALICQYDEEKRFRKKKNSSWFVFSMKILILLNGSLAFSGLFLI